MTAFSLVLTTAPTTGLDVRTHGRPGQPAPITTTVATEQRIPTPATSQNRQLPSRAFGLGMSNGGCVGPEIQRHVLGRPPGYRKLALLTRPVHWRRSAQGS